MMELDTDKSLCVAMAVHQCFLLVMGDGSEAHDADIIHAAVNIDKSSAYRYFDVLSRRCVWVLEHRPTDKILMIFASSDDGSYDYIGFPVPNEKSLRFGFESDEIYRAAQAVYDYFDSKSVPSHELMI